MAKSITITIKENSRSVVNCTTNVTVTCKITTSGDSWRGDHNTGTCTIDGTSYSFTAGAPQNSTSTLFTKTLNIKHDTTTGKKTLTVSCNYDSGWCTASKSQVLTTIDRYPNTPTINAPTSSIISETSTSIVVSWGITNRGTYTLEVSKNGGAWSVVASSIAIGTLSYTYAITPSQGDTYTFRVKAVYSGLSSNYSVSGTVTINKLSPPTIGTLGVFNPYVNSTYTVPLSGGSQSDGSGFTRRANIHVNGEYKYAGIVPSINGNTSVDIPANASSIIEDLGSTSYSNNTKFTVVAWCENSNGSRSSYISKTFTVNINTDGGATPTITASTISGGLFGYESTCFVAGVSTLQVDAGTVTLRRAPSGCYYNYKIEVTGYSSAGAFTKTYENLTAGVKTIKVTVTDSRGLSAIASTQIRVQAYAQPTIKSIFGSRLTDPNTSAQVTYTLSYTPIYTYIDDIDTQGTQLNGINSQEYSINDSSTWTTYSSGTTITNLDVGSTHTINLRVTDKIKTNNYVSASVLIPTIIVPFSIRRSGIGIKCIPQSGYVLDINGATRIVNGNKSIIMHDGVIDAIGTEGTNAKYGTGFIELTYSTPYIDFHYGNSTDDYNVRLVNDSSGQLTLVGDLNVQGHIKQMCYTIQGGADLNSYTSSGLYMCNEYDDYTNAPQSYLNGLLEVIGFSDNLIKQIYTHYDGTEWVRVYWFTNWGSWKQITN